ncbi:pyridoxal-dependent decarboxylase [Gilbertella persicaria]|uniref:pyridoxal-dependent decarboxylase n=1 Tax=Gilbertella persicaria TaxID=101096 RepID=UPI0022201208|nr:pyridoxal-dependent decarboxylase [Gilbertella persicaria]KAI8087831.1 pyridoxal-dependent decarboxylase [Gilbertella persicaria]
MPSNLETIVINPPRDLVNLFKSVPSPDVNVHNQSVREVIQAKLDSISNQKWETDQENAFFVGDLGEVFRQHLRWKALLPRIEPFFAVKSNPDPMVVKLLASLGCGFDCASKQEIQQVLDYGVDPSRIIYANPCKQASFIRYAAQQSVCRMTFDNAEELYKIKKLYPDAELVLRILTDDSMSLCQLGLKFGAPLHTVQDLLQTARDLDLNIVGVSFHVGSGCLDENAFGDAVLRARKVFDQAEQMGYKLSLLDVGGGFPGADVQDGITFEKVAAVLGPVVDRCFDPSIRVIAEPGRYYVASAFTICTNIIGRRTTLPPPPAASNYEEQLVEQKYMYYVNDGMYGSFNCIIFDHQVVRPKVLMRNEEFTYGQEVEEIHYDSSVWGPTCDSIDCLNKSTRLPTLEPGDWLYFENMGAYTICAASQFNGFRKSEVIYTNTFC